METRGIKTKNRLMKKGQLYPQIQLWLLLILLLTGSNMHAQQVNNYKLNQPFTFIENKGQLLDEYGNKLSDIKYYGHQGGVNLYCRPGKLSFVFTKVESEDGNLNEAIGNCLSSPLKIKKEKPKPSKISKSRADLVLIGANMNAQMVASAKQGYYENHRVSRDANDGFYTVNSYNTITYKNVYPNIDLVLYAYGDGIKYEFEVNTGGRVADIQMQWYGLAKMNITASGGIKYALPMDGTNAEMEESKPISFQNGSQIASSFIKNKNKISFNIGKYDHNKKLVIDPVIKWSTFFGGGTYKGYGLAADSTDNVYVTSGTVSYTGIATSGAYQTSFYSGSNASPFLAKFSANGTLLWATYFLQSDEGEGHGVAVDRHGGVYITGENWRIYNSIATSGAFLTSSGASTSSYLAKFSTSGSLVWATYIGAGGRTVANGIATDKLDNVYIAGMASNFDTTVVTHGTFKYNHSARNDAFIEKFNSSGKRIWGTYYGDSCDNEAASIAVDPNNNIFITGYTTDLKGIATSGAYQTINRGRDGGRYGDIFVAKFSSTGSLLWGTFYGGPGDEYAGAIACDLSGNAFIAGSTASGSYIATSGAFQSTGDTTGNSGHLSFLAKFSGTGSLLWGTYFPSGGSIFLGLATDKQGNLYYGDQGGDPYVPTKNAYLNNSNGSLFISKFNPAGKLTYGARIYTNNNLGALSTNHYSSGNSVFVYAGTYLARIDFKRYNNDAGIFSLSKTLPATFCASSKAIKVPVVNYGLKEMDSVYVGWSVNGTLQTPYKWTGALLTDSSADVTIGYYNFTPGTKTIKVWTYKPNGATTDSLPDNDTATITVKVNGTTASAGTAKTICSGGSDSLGMKAITGCTYTWSSKPSGFSSTVSKVVVSPVTTTTYYLIATESSSSCSATDSVTITVNPKPKAKFSLVDTIFCLNDTLAFRDSSTGGTSYAWNFGDNNTATSFSPKHKYASGGSYTIWLKVTSSSGCKDSTSMRVFIDSSCVWPGDAFHDSSAYMSDALAIGLAYNKTGSKRPNATTNWYGQPCRNWANNFSNGANYKHADCNGDGKVDSTDMKSISKNYNKTHKDHHAAISGSSSSSGPSLYFTVSKDTVKAKDTVLVYFNLGTSSKPASNVYGFAFTLGYDNAMVDTTKAILVDFSNSWLGTLGNNMLGLAHKDLKSASVDIALTRIDHSNASGNGKLGYMQVIMPENVGGKRYISRKLEFTIKNVIAINANGQKIGLHAAADTVINLQAVAGINNVEQALDNIKLYPNPATTLLHLDAGGLRISNVIIYDMLGNAVSTVQTGNKSQVDLPTDYLTKGIYFLNIKTNEGMVRKSFVKMQ